MKITKERLYKAFNERNAIQRFIARKLFNGFQRIGVHIVGDHFYELIPNTSFVKETYSEAKRPCTGIRFSFDKASNYVFQIINKWGYDFYSDASAFGYKHKNHYFIGLDALVLYSIIRDQRFSTVVEVGSGISTGIIQCAMTANYQETGIEGRFVSIDPYDRERERSKNLKGIKVNILHATLQNADASVFEKLNHNCLLFIDSSHVYKFGSDVKFFFEMILPVVGNGTVIHFHDIFSPYEYPLNWIVEEKRFWNEQYVLENFLRYNDYFETLIPLHYLARDCAKIRGCAESVCDHPDFRAQGGSFYIRRMT